MKYPKLRELREAIKALIKGPYTSKFPYQPHKPYERFRGRPEFHEEDCVGCGACFQVCPAKAIEMQDIKGKRILTVNWDTCIFCGQCQANCLTEKGIILSNEFDLATINKREDLQQTIDKELVLCDGCAEVIAPKDQLIWVIRKLGSLAFSNTSLMVHLMGENSLADTNLQLSSEPLSLRSDRFKLLCPKCRREAVVKS